MKMEKIIRQLENRKISLENTRKASKIVDEGLLVRIDEIEKTIKLIKGEM